MRTLPGTGYLQNGVEYPSPYDFSIYTDYLKVRRCMSRVHPSYFLLQALQQNIPPPPGSQAATLH